MLVGSLAGAGIALGVRFAQDGGVNVIAAIGSIIVVALLIGAMVWFRYRTAVRAASVNRGDTPSPTGSPWRRNWGRPLLFGFFLASFVNAAVRSLWKEEPAFVGVLVFISLVVACKAWNVRSAGGAGASSERS
jgi:uncharacterized membrane protein